MHNALLDIAAKLKNGQFPHEQAIKQGIVLRILSELSWDIYDPKTVWPEFNVSGTFVDFALCNVSGQPLVFIEVKQSTTFDVGEDQLMMRYAFQHGVPLAILTDGQRWSFYLPGGTGTFEERRFYHLDLLERSVNEAQSQFNRYLQFSNVISGAAADSARIDHADATRRRAGITALPQAWKELLLEGDDRLVAALLDKVETSTGYRPQEHEVKDFLVRVSDTISSDGFRAKTAVSTLGKSVVRRKSEDLGSPNNPRPTDRANVAANNDSNWYAVNDVEKMRSPRAIDVTVEALRELAGLCPEILEELASGSVGKSNRKVVKRRFIARTREELYSNPNMLRASLEIIPGWWLGTNYSNPSKASLLSLAQSVAQRHGIKFTFHLV